MKLKMKDFTGDFDLIAEIEQKTEFRFKNVDAFETYSNAIDNGGYYSYDFIFIRWLNNLNTPEFEKVNRSQYARGTIHMQENVEYHGHNCYIPTGGNCLIKCPTYLTGKEYTEDFLTFIRTEQRRSNVMTSARIQTFCRKYNINIGSYEGYRAYPGSIREKNIELKYIVINCLIWKSNDFSLNQAIKQLKYYFKVIHNVISDKHVKSFNNYEYKPKTIQSQLFNKIIYDVVTFKTDRAVHYANCIYRLGKISGKLSRDLTPKI